LEAAEGGPAPLRAKIVEWTSPVTED